MIGDALTVVAGGAGLLIGFALVKYVSDIADALTLLVELKRREQRGLEEELANLERAAAATRKGTKP